VRRTQELAQTALAQGLEQIPLAQALAQIRLRELPEREHHPSAVVLSGWSRRAPVPLEHQAKLVLLPLLAGCLELQAQLIRELARREQE
jgi:hypothetical protein